MVKVVVRQQVDSVDFLGGIFQEVESQYLEADYEGAMTSILGQLQIAHKTYFNAETDPNGSPWAPLAASTSSRKGHDTILNETGRLEGSLVGETGDSVRGKSNRALIFGTQVPYALFHDSGTANMPARPHVGWGEESVDEAMETVVAHLVEALKP